MSSRTPQDNNDNQDNQDDQDFEGTQRPRRQASSYEPSNDRNQEPEENQGDTLGKIYALDYVGRDYLLLPFPCVRILVNVDVLKNRTWKHPEFWWDVFMVMQKQVKLCHSQGPNDTPCVKMMRRKTRHNN
jgi:hypothetical protein